MGYIARLCSTMENSTRKSAKSLESVATERAPRPWVRESPPSGVELMVAVGEVAGGRAIVPPSGRWIATRYVTMACCLGTVPCGVRKQAVQAEPGSARKGLADASLRLRPNLFSSLALHPAPHTLRRSWPTPR